MTIWGVLLVLGVVIVASVVGTVIGVLLDRLL